jgi:hypothetical protein
MDCFRVEIAKNLLGIKQEIGKNEMAAINISALKREALKMNHPLYQLSCSKPENKPILDQHDISDGYITYPRDPSTVGLAITIDGLPKGSSESHVKKVPLLGRFKLEDPDFPIECSNTNIELTITEDNAVILLNCRNVENKKMEFDRASDYFNIAW